MGSTKSHLENGSDLQSRKKKSDFFFLESELKDRTLSARSPFFHSGSISLLQLYRHTARTYSSAVTSCFCSSPSWFRSNRLKTSPVLRESSGWFDSSCPGLDVVVWLSISPLSWASCTTTRHSSSVRKPGISDKNRGTKTRGKFNSGFTVCEANRLCKNKPWKMKLTFFVRSLFTH